MSGKKQKLALVLGHLPSVEDIDQFQLISDQYEIRVVSSQSICDHLKENSRFQDLTCLALPDYDENPSYLPGLEKVLLDFDYVIVKERVGLYAYQAVKAKFKRRFKLLVWCDNLCPYPAEDIDQLRTVRRELNETADGFIVQSKAARETLLIEGIKAERILMMPVWIQHPKEHSAKTRAAARAQLDWAEGDFIISFFGQIEAEEGLATLVFAISQLIQENPTLKYKLRLVFNGIGSYTHQLRQLCIELNIDAQTHFVAPERLYTQAFYAASDLIYFGTQPARDRIEGDVYRIFGAMAHQIPILASRSPLIEELCGKHRIDFCAGSVSSLQASIAKVIKSKALLHDIAQKNYAAYTKQGQEAEVRKAMLNCINLKKQEPVGTHSQLALEQQVLDVEAKVINKQYLEAIDVIAAIFRQPDVPTHHKANLYRLIGDSFAKLGDNENAKDAYHQCIVHDPYNAKAHIGLGTVALVRANFDVAVPHFQKAVALVPEDEMANLGLGLGFQGMDELKEATHWVTKSLEINPENLSAIFTLVKLAYDTNQYQAAEHALRAYIAVHPHDINILYTLGGICFKQANFRATEELMTRIIKSDPLDTRAHSLLKQSRLHKDEIKVGVGPA